MFEALATIPVNSLRVFEAAARLGSFARAASELNITPAAVSQQIKKIEARCGQQLFERVGREVRLTERGNRLRAGVEGGLRAIEVAVEEAMHQPTSIYISINTLSSIAARWLVPRLDRWRKIQPGVDIRISTSGELVDLRRDQLDLAIRIGDGNYPGLDRIHLLRDRIIPICSPVLLSGEPALSSPEELNQHTLIHFTPPYGTVRTDWSEWLAANGAEGVDPDRGMFFNDLVTAINAAMCGQGVLLAPRSHVEDDLRSGLLAAPFGDKVHRPADWHIVTPSSRPVPPHIGEFIDWLLSEARQADS